MSAVRPVLLERRVLPKVWGGFALAEMFGVEPPGGEPFGETWEVYDRPDGSNQVRDRGGVTLADLLADDAVGWLGRGVEPGPGGRFPLLIKFVDAAEPLSVQVHPGPELAAGTGDGPKDEAWVVLRAGPDARIVRGFAPGVTREQIASAAGSAAIEPLLRAFTPTEGDVIPIEAGTVHAIGPDVVVFEVQQNSDVTWRLWDWGRSRELHVDDALLAARFESEEVSAPVEPEIIDDRASWLVRSPHFRVRRCQLDEPATLSTEGSFKVMNVLDGFAAIGWHSGGDDPPLRARRGDTVLIPAAIELVFVSPIGSLDFLWTDPGAES